MKKLFTTTAILLLTIILNATVWRVNNRPNVNADFTTLQLAIDGASQGDTLYIGASETSYGPGIFTKQLIVIGAGYWLAENDTTQMYTEESQTGRLTFNDGSQGSEALGLYIYENNTNATKSITDWHIPPIVNAIATLKSVRDSVKQYNTPHDFSKSCDCVMCRFNDSEGWNYEDTCYMMGLGLNIKKVLGVE